MKKLLINLVLLLLVLTSCNNKEEPRTIIKGQLNNYAKATKLYLYKIDYFDLKKDVAYISEIDKNGNYRFEFTDLDTSLYFVCIDSSEWKEFKEVFEIYSVYDDRFDSGNCISVYYWKKGIFYINPNTKVDLDIDFKIIEPSFNIQGKIGGLENSNVKENTKLIFDETHISERLFQKFFILAFQSELYEQLTDTGKIVRPKYMEIEKAYELMQTYQEKILIEIDTLRSINKSLYNYFKMVYVYDSKRTLQRYYSYIHKERVNDFYFKDKEFAEYQSLFNLKFEPYMDFCRESIQEMMRNTVYLKNKELHQFEKYYPWSEEMKSFFLKNYNCEIGQKYVKAWEEISTGEIEYKKPVFIEPETN